MRDKMKSWKVLCCSMIVLVLAVWAAAGSAEEVIVGYSGPLSGPGAEYGLDNVNGVDMAIREINIGGGITVKGKNYTFKLHRLDDRAGMAEAVSNARRFVAQDKAPVVFNSSATTIGALLRINEVKGSEFLVVGYTSAHAVHNLDNKLLINPTPDLLAYVAAA